MKYIWSGGDFIPAEQYVRPAPARSHLPCPHIMGDLPAYASPLSGQVIEGRFARKEEMKRHNVREVDPSERPEGAGIVKSKAQAEAERKQLEARPKYQMSEQTRKRLLQN